MFRAIMRELNKKKKFTFFRKKFAFSFVVK